MIGLTPGALGLAFSAGLLASVNPCGVVLLPSIISFYLGQDRGDYAARPLARRVGEGLRLGGLVTTGFLLVFVVVGMLVSAGAGAMARVFPWATVLVGALLVVLGVRLYLGRGLSLPLPHLEAARVVGSARAMFLYGVGYALASLGCTLPIFLIAVGAALTTGVVGSLVLFVAYSLGMGLVLTAVALGAALVQGVVSTTLRRVLPYVQQVSALLLVAAGSYILWTDLPLLVA